MESISKTDEGMFLKLFIRDGFVFNFSNSTFDSFTMAIKQGGRKI